MFTLWNAQLSMQFCASCLGIFDLPRIYAIMFWQPDCEGENLIWSWLLRVRLMTVVCRYPCQKSVKKQAFPTC